MTTALIVIVSLVIAIIIVYFIAKARIAKNMREQLRPYELEAGSDRACFEDSGIKYDTEKYNEYLRGYVEKLPDSQLSFVLVQRGKRSDVWNTMFCAAARAEQERRAASSVAEDTESDVEIEQEDEE